MGNQCTTVCCGNDQNGEVNTGTKDLLASGFNNKQYKDQM
tara:strand:+ start:132 stop:251 length:120 start_codon:yes stop_codon:yes gene_type:complete